MWFSVVCFGVRVSVMFHLMFVHFTFRFGSRVAIFWEIAKHLVGQLFLLSFVYLYFLFMSHFGIKSGIWLLIAPVPVH